MGFPGSALDIAGVGGNSERLKALLLKHPPIKFKESLRRGNGLKCRSVQLDPLSDSGPIIRAERNGVIEPPFGECSVDRSQRFECVLRRLGELNITNDKGRQRSSELSRRHEPVLTVRSARPGNQIAYL